MNANQINMTFFYMIYHEKFAKFLLFNTMISVYNIG